MRTLVLWDIDGTLIRGNRVATAMFNRALRDVYELDGEPARIEYGGKTDPQIVLEVLALHAVEEAAALDRLGRFREHYAELVSAAYDELCAGLARLPGVPAILEALHEVGAVQSLVTGNLRDTAELKLRAAGLLRWLDMDAGGFGSDNRDRDLLVPLATKRAVTRHGVLDRVVVVGDTPRDIACGRAGGARTVAVATGSWSYEALLPHAPDVVLPSLADIPAAMAAIMGS